MLEELKLVTIVTEGLLKDKIIELLHAQGATGFTIIRAEGRGSRGVQASDWEGPNFKFECVASPEVANKIVDAVSKKFLEHYAVIVWISTVNVLRGGKFVKP
jgi:nitrogen regulatory protein P-II 2